MKNFGYLTSEEYRALRKLLGFTQKEAMKFHGVSRDLTIKQWERGKSTTSTAACDKITSLMEKINDLIEEIITKWEKEQNEVFLITYDEEDYTKYIYGVGRNLPHNVHTMMIYRVYVELKRLGAKAYIVKFNKPSYAFFLQERGQMDSPENRNEWAAWYRTNYFRVIPEEKEEKREPKHTIEDLYWYTQTHEVKPIVAKIIELKLAENNFTQIAQALGVSRQYIYQLYRELDNLDF